MGIGFFSTITNEINVENVGVSAGTVRVSNIALSKISVNNQSQKVKNTDSIINFLLTNTGWLVGSLISGILNIITLGECKIKLRRFIKSPFKCQSGRSVCLCDGGVCRKNHWRCRYF